MSGLSYAGSGKTSLLNALAGQTQKAKRVKLVGRLLVNGKASASLKEHKVAYVRQDDIFYSQLTVRGRATENRLLLQDSIEETPVATFPFEELGDTFSPHWRGCALFLVETFSTK